MEYQLSGGLGLLVDCVAGPSNIFNRAEVKEKGMCFFFTCVASLLHMFSIPSGTLISSFKMMPQQNYTYIHLPQILLLNIVHIIHVHMCT